MSATLLEGNRDAVSRRVSERRLTERVRKKWAGLAAGGVPELKAIEALNLGPDRGFCFVIDLRLSDIFPYFTSMGEQLARFSDVYLMGDARRDKTLLDAAMVKMDEAALTRQPVGFSEVKRLDNGARVAFRAILLPVSENSADVTHIFGAVRGRIL